jgi:hypothetical protein
MPSNDSFNLDKFSWELKENPQKLIKFKEINFSKLFSIADISINPKPNQKAKMIIKRNIRKQKVLQLNL